MSLTIRFTPEFVKSYNKLEKDLQSEVKVKIDLFKDVSNHKNLKVHKLHGRLKTNHSFSINYRYRVIFKYLDKKTIAFVSIGDHDIYK